MTQTPISLDDQTPLMKQYWELKSQVPDALLFFRMGDFYELFGNDAVLASQLLEITLTSRDKNKPNPMPMAGVPHHSVQGYIQRLLKAGKKIAIGEQLEEVENSSAGKNGPKIVKREIVRVLTPAVQFDAEGSETHFLATACRTEDKKWVLACLDPSTGETLTSSPLETSSLEDEIQRLPIRHFLNSDRVELSLQRESLLTESLPANYLAMDKAVLLLKHHYEVENLEPFIPHPTGALALGILVLYTLRTQKQDRLSHLRLPEPLHQPKSMALGPNTAQHLD